MDLLRRILLSLAVVAAGLVAGGGGVAVVAALTLLLSQLAMAALSRHLRGGFRVAAAVVTALGFGFMSVLAVCTLLPRLAFAPLFPDDVFLQQHYAGVLILAFLTALVQALVGGWSLGLHLGAAQPPKAFRGLPLVLLTVALALLALSGFSGMVL